MKIISIGKAAEMIGVTTQTLRDYDTKGILKPDRKTPKGTRYYSLEEVEKYIEKCKNQ